MLAYYFLMKFLVRILLNALITLYLFSKLFEIMFHLAFGSIHAWISVTVSDRRSGIAVQ